MDEAERAYEKALTFLEKRDRTEREVADRLTRAGFSPEIIRDTTLRLIEAGYVNDADYAERYLEALTAKGRGRLRAYAEMRRKGLPEDLVRYTIEDGVSAADERKRALETARNAMTGIPDGADKNKVLAKINRKLVSLGYSYDIIGEVMSALRTGSIDDE